MMTRALRRPRWLAPTVLALAMAAGACSDSTDNDDDHSEPEGLIASIASVEVVRVNAARTVTGEFTAVVGQPDAIDVTFLDADGDPITIDDSEYYLAFEVANGTIAEIEQMVLGAFTFYIDGLNPGSTTMLIKLMHGQHPSGHADYISPSIPVTVESPPT